MKKISKFLLATVAVFVLVFSMLYFYITRENNVNIAAAHTEIQISSESLISSFLNNESSANSEYIEKTIEIAGVIKDITFLNNRYTVLLQGETDFSCVICDMQSNQYKSIKKLELGQNIVLKGICKGFLMDAIFLDCIILNPKDNE
ncbi:OB-fold protein [Maribacter antarcticus]|uniref:OB-fold protein n=1 Tax=Maribacter antarcticus TaxID=505250 RepID=UPI00047C93CE|nr:hypothetical protein [Maribacter antarcticus]